MLEESTHQEVYQRVKINQSMMDIFEKIHCIEDCLEQALPPDP